MSLVGLIAGDYGAVLTGTVKQDGVAVDISSYTTRQFLLLKPSGELLAKTATFVGTGTDGQLKYTIAAADLDESGTWSIQVKLTKATAILTSRPVRFEVGGVLA